MVEALCPSHRCAYRRPSYRRISYLFLFLRFFDLRRPYRRGVGRGARSDGISRRGGLPPRGEPDSPRAEPTEAESLYLRKLLDAYGHHLGMPLTDRKVLAPHPDLDVHYKRQRVLFYSAESLRNFARDRTPPRAFHSLEDDVYNGAIDTCEASHADALERVRKTVAAAEQLDVSGNALVGVTKVADKQGICHQLANDDRLTWTKQP